MILYGDRNDDIYIYINIYMNIYTSENACFIIFRSMSFNKFQRHTQYINTLYIISIHMSHEKNTFLLSIESWLFK